MPGCPEIALGAFFNSQVQEISTVIARKYEAIVFAFFMALLMSCLMSLIVSILNVGFVDNLLSIWMKAWAGAFPVAFPAVFLVAPVVRNLTERVLDIERGAR